MFSLCPETAVKTTSGHLIGNPLSLSCLLVSLPLSGFGLLADTLLDGNCEDRVLAEYATGTPRYTIRV
jgi:hypothetical protein